MATKETGIIVSAKDGCFQWNIEDVDITWETDINMSSPRFTFSGGKYQIDMWKSTDSSNMEIKFRRPSSAAVGTLFIEFQMRTGSENMSQLYTITAINKALSFLYCAVDMTEYQEKHDYVDLTLSFRLKTVSDGKKLKALSKLQKDMEKLYLNGEDSDVTVEVRGKQFLLHRAILMARSPFFKAMFSHDMEEKFSGHVAIKDCDPRIFSDLLNYLYTGTIDHIDDENVCQLYTASDKYQVEELKAECTEFMNIHLSVEMFCDIIILALKHTEEELIDSLTEFFCENAVEVAKTAKWETFLRENSTFGNELFLKALQREKKVIDLPKCKK